MRTSTIEVTPATYAPHLLHQGEDWAETNCGFDALVAVLHTLGLDPMPVAAVVLSSDYEGDQWTMFKIPPEELFGVYGIELHEMNAYRPVLDHVVTQIGLGRLMTLEVDSFYLPDTAGVSYRDEHVKTGIVVNHVDVAQQRLGYFHNAGYFELEGEDFEGLLGLGDAHPDRLAPYLELVRLERLRRPEAAELRRQALRLVATHLQRRPADDPVARMTAHLDASTEQIAAAGPDAFHKLAFSTLRQCGAAAFTAALLCAWLADRGVDHADALVDAGEQFQLVAGTAKSSQLKLARRARGREVDLSANWSALSEQWAAAHAHLEPFTSP